MKIYDRINDPSEMNNVYNDPNYKDVVVKLRMELKEMRIKYKDSEVASWFRIWRWSGWIWYN